MADVKGLERRIEELERKLRERVDKPQRRVLGSAEVPLLTFFLKDAKTGSVASVDYDSSTGALRVTKVR